MRLRNKKTEEIVDVYNIYISKRVEDDSLTSHENVIRSFDSIAELNEELEDYKPTEPLIKDEKIRKAVRAWAEANRDVSQVMFSKDVTGKSYSYLTDTDSDAQIKFNFVIDGELDIYEVYTITELCGEEEE